MKLGEMQRTLVRFGVYSRSQIGKLERVKQEFLNGGSLPLRKRVALHDYLYLLDVVPKGKLEGLFQEKEELIWRAEGPDGEPFAEIEDQNGKSFYVGYFYESTVPSAFLEQLNIREGERFWDIGCGIAEDVIRLALKHPKTKFVGIDASVTNIQRALNTLQGMDNPPANLALKLGDFSIYPIRRKSIDTAVMKATLVGLPRRRSELLIRKLTRSINIRDGRVYVTISMNYFDEQLFVLEVAGLGGRVERAEVFDSHEEGLFLKLNLS